MEVILLEQIRNLGNIGDKVSIKSGYGRNFLIPQGKVVPATEDNIKQFEEKRAELEAKASEIRAAAEERAAKLRDLSITMASKSGDEGKLFGSIGTRDIAEAISSQSIDVAKSEIILPDGAIRNTGEYAIDVQLHTEIVVTVRVAVISDDN